MAPLVQARRFTVVTRVDLEKVLDEIALGSSGLLDPEQAQAFGRLAGVDIIVTGTISVFTPDALSVSTRFIDVSTGAIAVAETQTVASAAEFSDAAHTVPKSGGAIWTATRRLVTARTNDGEEVPRMSALAGNRVVMVTAHEFEDIEVLYPVLRLSEVGIMTTVAPVQKPAFAHFHARTPHPTKPITGQFGCTVPFIALTEVLRYSRHIETTDLALDGIRCARAAGWVRAGLPAPR